MTHPEPVPLVCRRSRPEGRRRHHLRQTGMACSGPRGCGLPTGGGFRRLTVRHRTSPRRRCDEVPNGFEDTPCLVLRGTGRREPAALSFRRKAYGPSAAEIYVTSPLKEGVHPTFSQVNAVLTA